jgi:uncharacterized protein (DUF488 family)
MRGGSEKSLRLFTVGHSNRSFEDFLSLLREFGIQVVVDIRRYPGSRKFPHFNRAVLCNLLKAEDIEYLWLEALGGRRHTGTNDKSPNAGLKSPGFRNYADHMTTDGFREAVRELVSVAVKLPTAVMCAEKLYWKCHRRLLSDHLVAQGVEVVHIVESGRIFAHKLTAGAVVTANGGVCYPSDCVREAHNEVGYLSGCSAAEV